MIHYRYDKDEFYWALKLASMPSGDTKAIFECDVCKESVHVAVDNEKFRWQVEELFLSLHRHDEVESTTTVTHTLTGMVTVGRTFKGDEKASP